MDNTNVLVILVCHNMEIINSIFSNSINNNFHILFVGNNDISDEFANHPRITIARNLENNIENDKDLLTFTAWYAIVKNNLFTEYTYLCILEYDVKLEPHFETQLVKTCNLNNYDIISFLKIHNCFKLDIKENIIKYFLAKKGLPINFPNLWFPTTNHCLKRCHLEKFVDWYYPDCLEIKKLDPSNISWYHERLFNIFVFLNSFQTFFLENCLFHQMLNSHKYMHSIYNIDNNLIDHYIKNPNCEFLNKLTQHYQFFLCLNKNFNTNCGSYLCYKQYIYTYNIYEKQKLLFYTAKKSKNALLIGNYMGHIAFIMLMANPDLNITCIDCENNKYYIYLLDNYFKKKIKFLTCDTQQNMISSLYKIDHDFDFIHISQQYPTREYINIYSNICFKNTQLTGLTCIIDDYNVYSNEIIEKIKYDNYHCEISNEQIVHGSNTTKIFDVKINKKYLLIYDDENEQFKNDREQLIHSAQKYDNFEIIIFHKKDIDNEFIDQYKYILDQHRGGGYWLWKPYIINETLKKIKDNDIVFYLDAKYYFTENFNDLLKPLSTNDFLIWKNKPNEPSYYLKNWCKMDIIQKYNIYGDVFQNNIEACWAGAMVMKKTNQVTSIIEEWLGMCCCEDITDAPSNIPNSSDFIEHRHDQSLLSILISKYKIPLHTFEKRFLQNVRIPY